MFFTFLPYLFKNKLITKICVHSSLRNLPTENSKDEVRIQSYEGVLEHCVGR